VTWVSILWESASWSIFLAREKAIDLTFIDLQKELTLSVGDGNDAKLLLSSSAFKGLFRFSHRESIVTGMIHDQFMEYLLARWFVRNCTGGGQNLRTILSKQINVDANRFIKSAWSTSPEVILKQTLKNLEKIGRWADKGDSPSALMVHANCVYYISRVPMVEDAKVTLRHLLSGVKHLYCRNGILFALLRLGDLAAEQQLYESLSTSEEADKLNRGLHLEYFKDAASGDLGTPPIDNNETDWERCLLGLIEHVEDNSDRFALSRRIDLFTIRSLLKSRGKLGPLTPERIKRIRTAALAGDNMQRMPHNFREGVSSELIEFLRMVRNIRKLQNN